MLVAMGLAAALCIFFGVYPDPLYALLPYEVDYEPYTTSHVLSQMQLLFFAMLAFALLIRTGLYPAERPSTNLNSDWLYRWLAPRIVRAATAVIAAVDDAARASAMRAIGRTIDATRRMYGPQARVARGLATSGATIWVALLLAATLVIAYWQGGG